MQEKKKAEADKQKELNDLFAIAIKQPKVPPGEGPYIKPAYLTSGSQQTRESIAVKAKTKGAFIYGPLGLSFHSSTFPCLRAI